MKIGIRTSFLVCLTLVLAFVVSTAYAAPAPGKSDAPEFTVALPKAEAMKAVSKVLRLDNSFDRADSETDMIYSTVEKAATVLSFGDKHRYRRVVVSMFDGENNTTMIRVRGEYIERNDKRSQNTPLDWAGSKVDQKYSQAVASKLQELLATTQASK